MIVGLIWHSKQQKEFDAMAKAYMSAEQLSVVALSSKSVKRTFDCCLRIESMDKSKLTPSSLH